MKLTVITAFGLNKEIGLNNDLPWGKIEADMKHFKNITKGGTIIMGRKTFDSLPKVLPNRKHIVITTQEKKNKKDVVYVRSKTEALELAERLKLPVYVIGGATIYKLFAKETTDIIVTELQEKYEADTFFPWDLYVERVDQIELTESVKEEMLDLYFLHYQLIK